MAEPPIITVAFPVYNPGELVFTALNSILSQTFEDFEVLLIDDGSHENITRRLARIDDRRLRIIKHNENKGLAYRLNEAVALSQGKYIARMDHDDISSPNRLKVQYKFLQENPTVDLVASRCVTINENNELIGKLKCVPEGAPLNSRPWQGFYLPHPTWMGKASWFKANPYAQPAPYRCEDQELMLRTYKESNFAVIPQYLLAYRIESRKTYSSNSIKTASAVYLFQIKYFSAEKEWLNLLLCTSVFAIKLVKNIIAPAIIAISKSINYKLRAKNALDCELSEHWESIISKLNKINHENKRI